MQPTPLYKECNMVNAVGEIQQCNYKTANIPLFKASDFDLWFDKSCEKIVREIEECASKDSGWSLHAIVNLELRVNKYVPLRGSSYLLLPDKISKTKSVINVQNADEDERLHPCFVPLPTKIPNYPEDLRKYQKQYDWSMIDFPTPIKDIKHLEKVNRVSINVFALDEEDCHKLERIVMLEPKIKKQVKSKIHRCISNTMSVQQNFRS
ncbi:hypothetical protein B566_EDAN016623 [Ephemera danica]|nr:hypothetical protein B566_EDAN016623 [Ephemera danica]